MINKNNKKKSQRTADFGTISEKFPFTALNSVLTMSLHFCNFSSVPPSLLIPATEKMVSLIQILLS
jgi:hypothetical protein